MDIWGLGVVLYAILSGYLPFESKGNVSAATFIKQGKFDFKRPQFAYVPETAKDLIRRLLTVNPSDRASIEEVLSHPWLQEDEMELNGYFQRTLYTDGDMQQPPAKRRRIDWI